MGLTHSSTGRGAVDGGIAIERKQPGDRVIALAGNPNVGKSTLFNTLTGLHQHTGNWPGKTVASATGYVRVGDRGYHLVDIPGTYSLFASSEEEEVARDFLLFGGADAAVVVCDACALERNLNLVLQVTEIASHTVLCLNLVEEAEKKHIRISPERLSNALGIPVVAVNARRRKTLSPLLPLLDAPPASPPTRVDYGEKIEDAIHRVEPQISATLGAACPARWLALRLLAPDAALTETLLRHLGRDPMEVPGIAGAVTEARASLAAVGLSGETLRDRIAERIMSLAHTVAADAVTLPPKGTRDRDRAIDRIVTGRVTAYPILLLLLLLVFWLTIVGANYPSAALSKLLFSLEAPLGRLFALWHFPAWLSGLLIDGVFRTVAWITSVMLPPMAIFFPLFTLLEDVGFLPRIAYNLDRPFCACHACGKQALTMCMGFGCNAAGVVGCRIIDSPRERLLAILTNALVPCNGRFPTLITVLTVFFVGTASGMFASLTSALLLTGIIVLSVLVTLLATRLLSVTCLHGAPSGFTLELPPYRPPQIGQILVRSVLDRTLFVLGRAVAVAAPAGAVIWLLANVSPGGVSLLARAAEILDPIGHFIGMDGVLLLAFILALPANEILLPVALMAYTAGTSLTDLSAGGELHTLLLSAGWSRETALCLVFFCLFHWPCSTTIITIRKETKSLRWTLLACLLPTLFGILFCLLTRAVFAIARA